MMFVGIVMNFEKQYTEKVLWTDTRTQAPAGLRWSLGLGEYVNSSVCKASLVFEVLLIASHDATICEIGKRVIYVYKLRLGFIWPCLKPLISPMSTFFLNWTMNTTQKSCYLQLCEWCNLVALFLRPYPVPFIGGHWWNSLTQNL